MFHRFHHAGDKPTGQGSITAEQFEKMLLFVGVNNIISPDDWMLRLKNNALQQNDLCITLDDSLKCQYEVCLPVLEKYDLKAFWFIYSSVFDGEYMKYEIYNCFAMQNFSSMDAFFKAFFEKCGSSIMRKLESDIFQNYAKKTHALCPFYTEYDLKFRFIRNALLSKEEFECINDQMIMESGSTLSEFAKILWLSIEELKWISSKGHCIGLHSYSHPFQMEKLSSLEQRNQYLKNYDHIKQICGDIPLTSMSHPVNSYNDDTIEILKNMGITCGFRSNMQAPADTINPNCLELAREDSTNIIKMMESTGIV